MVCSQCQAVAWYKFKRSQADAAKALGGHFSLGKQFYCPECAASLTQVQRSRERIQWYMKRCWADPNEVWEHAGLQCQPEITSTRLKDKEKAELQPDAKTDIAVAVWQNLDHIESAPPPPAPAACASPAHQTQLTQPTKRKVEAAGGAR